MSLLLLLAAALAQDCPPDLSPEACAELGAYLAQQEAEAAAEAARAAEDAAAAERAAMEALYEAPARDPYAAVQDDSFRLSTVDPDAPPEQLRDEAGNAFDHGGRLELLPEDFQRVVDEGFPIVEVPPPVPVPEPPPPEPSDLPTGPAIHTTPPPPLP